MSNIISEIARKLFRAEKVIDKFFIKKVIVGLRYTGILLSDNSFGLAYTLDDSKKEKNRQKEYAKNAPFTEWKSEDVINLYRSKYSIFRSIGLATLNAYSQAIIQPKINHSDSILDILLESKPSIVGMVGNIESIKDSLVANDFHVKVLDQSIPAQSSDQITPVFSVNDLEHLDHIIISGSALVFDNFPRIIEILNTISGERILVGPSAQLHPEIAFEIGFTSIGASQVIDIDSTLRVIMEGGSYQSFKDYIKKYQFHKKNSP